MLTIHLDHQVTRRKYFHFVVDEAGDPIWRGRSIEAALDFIIERGDTAAIVKIGRKHYRLTLVPVTHT